MTNKDKKIIVLNEVESTNNYAKQLILSNAAEEGTVVMTHFQEKGKGQQGNSWESEHGMNVLASYILFPDFLAAGKQFLISKLVSLALLDLLQKETDNVSIKWPNDIYIEDKKVAGILIENTVKGRNLSDSIIGIGLNLNQLEFVSGAPNPVSLKQITGKNYSIEEVVTEIANQVNVWYKILQLGKFDEIDLAYFSQLFRANQWTMFSRAKNYFEAKIVGIGEFGQLILEDRKGISTAYMFKEVEFVIE